MLSSYNDLYKRGNKSLLPSCLTASKWLMNDMLLILAHFERTYQLCPVKRKWREANRLIAVHWESSPFVGWVEERNINLKGFNK